MPDLIDEVCKGVNSTLNLAMQQTFVVLTIILLLGAVLSLFISRMKKKA
jgi:hypothetical protein